MQIWSNRIKRTEDAVLSAKREEADICKTGEATCLKEIEIRSLFRRLGMCQNFVGIDMEKQKLNVYLNNLSACIEISSTVLGIFMAWELIILKNAVWENLCGNIGKSFCQVSLLGIQGSRCKFQRQTS